MRVIWHVWKIVHCTYSYGKWLSQDQTRTHLVIAGNVSGMSRLNLRVIGAVWTKFASQKSRLEKNCESQEKPSGKNAFFMNSQAAGTGRSAHTATAAVLLLTLACRHKVLLTQRIGCLLQSRWKNIEDSKGMKETMHGQEKLTQKDLESLTN